MITDEINGGPVSILEACSFGKYAKQICNLLQAFLKIEKLEDLSRLTPKEIDEVFLQLRLNDDQLWEMINLSGHCVSPASYRAYRLSQLKKPKSMTNRQYPSRYTPRNLGASVTTPTNTRNGNTGLHVLLQQMRTIR
jgi:hypothetical protein